LVAYYFFNFNRDFSIFSPAEAVIFISDMGTAIPEEQKVFFFFSEILK
jgi:hypothetical protein